MAKVSNTRAERRLRFKKEGIGVNEVTTLSQHLTLIGRLSALDPAIVTLAHVYYVKRGFSARETANSIGKSLDLVKDWIASFDWDEEIANRKRLQWERLQKMGKQRGDLVDVNVEIGMKSAERIAAEWLTRHQKAEVRMMESDCTDEEREQCRQFLLRPGEVKTIVGILKETNEKRRSLAGLKKDPREHHIKVDITHNADTVGHVAAGLATILDKNDNLLRAKIEHNARPVAEIMDAEFEIREEESDDL